MHFDPTAVEPRLGSRLYDSVGLQFVHATTVNPGIDEFATPGSPFDIKDVVMQYNSTTGKQEVVGTEDDSNWESLKDGADYKGTGTIPQYNWMVRFPKFYYKRPNRYTFLVSSNPITGFKPSPMHYRNGIMHDYVYISKFLMSFYYKNGANADDGFVYRSSTSDTGNFKDGGATLDEARSELKKEGMYVFDYAAYCSIAILVMIKYATLDTDKEFGSITNVSVDSGTCLDILGKDGCGATLTVTSGGLGTMVLGLENYVGTNKQLSIDGCGWNSNSTDGNREFYINTDLENIARCPDFVSEDYTGYIKVKDNLLSGNSFNISCDIGYDPTFDWALYPEFKNSLSNMISKSAVYISSNSTSNGIMTIYGSNSDILTFYLTENRTLTNQWYRSIVY